MRKTTLTKLATIYGLIYCYYEDLEEIQTDLVQMLLQYIYNLMEHYIYSPSLKELNNLKQNIIDIEKEGRYLTLDISVIFGLLDQIIEDERLHIRYSEKLKAMNELQEYLIELKDYAELTDYQLDIAESINQFINKQVRY